MSSVKKRMEKFPRRKRFLTFPPAANRYEGVVVGTKCAGCGKSLYKYEREIAESLCSSCQDLQLL